MDSSTTNDEKDLLVCQALGPDRVLMPCKHPKACERTTREGSIRFCEACAMQAEAVKAEHAQLVDKMHCGHPVACVEGEGLTHWCGVCAELAREVAKAVAVEREACAALIQAITGIPPMTDFIASLIRARTPK